MSDPFQVSLRQRAIADADSAFDYFRAEAPAGTAENFVAALERAVGLLARHPLSGSSRFAFELDIPNLRTWPLERFPYLIFYAVSNNEIDVWRILHASRDLPASLADEQSDPGLS